MRHVTVGTDCEAPEDVVARITKYLADKYPQCSPEEALASLPKDQRIAWLSGLSEQEQHILEYEWLFHARPKQRAPKGNWKVLIFLAVRGFVKTKSAAEVVRGWVESGEKKHIALLGATASDLRDTMVEATFKQGSGLLQICPPWNRPHYSPTKKTLVWTNPNFPSYGAVCSLYSAEEPNQLRSPSHDAAWIDEWCKMPYGDTAFHMLKFTMRLGKNPQIVISTTPKPVLFLIEMLQQAEESQRDGTRDIIVVKGNTYENRSNLSTSFLGDINQMYEGTTLGRQEIYADLILDAEGALWNLKMIDDFRLRMSQDGQIHFPSFYQTVIGVDPQTGYKDDSKFGGEISTKKTRIARSTLTGIVPVSMSMPVRGIPPHVYVRDDMSVNGKPEQWGKVVVEAYRKYQASLVIAESNQGGQMIKSVIQTVDPSVRVLLKTAVGKKHERAIPVVAKYQQGRVHHCGILSGLEQEMCIYEPGDEDKHLSPNRMDALVLAVRHLIVDGMRAGAGIAIGRRI